MEGKQPRGRPRTKWLYEIRKDIEMGEGNWEEIQENRRWENRDFSVIMNPYNEQLKNYNDNNDDDKLHCLVQPLS